MQTRLGFAAPRLARVLVASVAACSVTACWSGASSEDDGAICVAAAQFQGTGSVRLASDAPLSLFVSTSACLSSACTRNRRASCSVVLSGSELFLSSHFHWEERGAYPSGCTDDCVSLQAECETPALPSGTYVVRHGDDAFTLQIPGQLASGCLSAP